MVEIGCPCLPRRHIAGEAWLGHAVGLHRVSLKYSKRAEESAYLHYCSGRVRKSWCILMGAMFLWSVLLLLVDPPYSIAQVGFPDTDSAIYPIILTRSIKHILMALISLAELILFITPQLWKRLSVSVCEKVVVATAIYAILSSLDGYYVTKLHGHADPVLLFPEMESHTDSLAFLGYCILLLVTHVWLPVRWYILVAVEVHVLLQYATITFVLGTPEGQAYGCLFELCVAVLLISFGKRQAEVNDRLVFFSLVAEKSLRMQAEFKLSQASDRRKSSDDAASITPSGAAFRDLDDSAEIRQNLGTILEIGKSEQWLIDASELVAQPHLGLGRGGFGMVIAGGFHGSPVALKFHAMNGTVKPLDDMGNELRLLRKMRHPNIVLLHGACLSVADSDLVLVMERVFGESMLLFVQGEPPRQERWQSLQDTCLALRYIHSRSPPIVHGDLKPDNIMVERHNEGVRAKLLDFGLARLLTSAKPGGGTYRWMAPNLLKRGGPPRLEDDTYSLGLVIFFATTGGIPFPGLSRSGLRAIAKGAAERQALDWPAEAPELAQRCRPIVASCTQVAGECRPPVERVHELISEPGVRGFDDPEVQPPPPPGEGAGPERAAGLWRAVHRARRMAADRANRKQEVLSWMWGVRRQVLSAGGARRRQAAGSGNAQVAPPPDANAAEASPQLPARLHPKFQVTPRDSLVNSLFQLMLQWNGAALPRCCRFHTVMGLLQSLSVELEAKPCMEELMEVGGVKTFQCPQCLLLYYTTSDTDELECDICGYEGTPLRSASGG